MGELVRMTPEDFEAARDQVRISNTADLKRLAQALEPYVDGSLGPISPAHASVYLKTIREVGLLWKAYERPGVVEGPGGGDEELMVLEARQAAVLAELDKLRQVRRPGRAS